MHQTNLHARTRELVLFEADNPRALTAILPEVLGRQLRLQWDARPDLFILNERQLVREMKANDRPLTALDHGLRWRFWMEYERVSNEARPTKMDMAYVLGRSFAKEKFYRYATDPYRLAYLVLPPSDYQAAAELCLSLAMNRLMEIVETSHIDPSGYVNHHIIEKILKVTESLHSKVIGMKIRVGKGGGKEGDTPESDEPSAPGETPDQKLARLKAEAERLKNEKQVQLDKNNLPPPDAEA